MKALRYLRVLGGFGTRLHAEASSVRLRYAMIFLVLFSCLFCIGAPLSAGDRVVDVYNWSNYISDQVLKEFTQETGIKVNYTTYDSNETMYAKLKANPHSGYDIVVPSTYFVDRMRRQGMLRVLDKTKLDNIKHLDPVLLNRAYDPGNHYSIPYLWSGTGIAVNARYHALAHVQHWQALWRPEYRHQLLLLDDIREVFSVALLSLAYSPNDVNPEHIRQAYVKLKELMPNVRLFSNDGVKSLYIDEDLTLGMAWNGDVYQADQENPAIRFVYPKEGFVISIDSVAIPSGARHVDNAYRFINFLLRPEIAKQISLGTGYASPNRSAVQLMPKAVLHNPVIYPDPKTLRRGVVQLDVGKAEFIYQKYWELLKIGN